MTAEALGCRVTRKLSEELQATQQQDSLVLKQQSGRYEGGSPIVSAVGRLPGAPAPGRPLGALQAAREAAAHTARPGGLGGLDVSPSGLGLSGGEGCPSAGFTDLFNVREGAAPGRGHRARAPGAPSGSAGSLLHVLQSGCGC